MTAWRAAAAGSGLARTPRRERTEKGKKTLPLPFEKKKIMVSIEGLTVEFGGFTLLDGLSFVVNRKDRIALVGKNGAGKSTLLKILAGMQQPTRGTVSIPRDTTVGYLPQQMQLSDTRSVREETEQAFAHIHATEADIERINRELSERTDYEV